MMKNLLDFRMVLGSDFRMVIEGDVQWRMWVMWCSIWLCTGELVWVCNEEEELQLDRSTTKRPLALLHNNLPRCETAARDWRGASATPAGWRTWMSAFVRQWGPPPAERESFELGATAMSRWVLVAHLTLPPSWHRILPMRSRGMDFHHCRCALPTPSGNLHHSQSRSSIGELLIFLRSVLGVPYLTPVAMWHSPESSVTVNRGVVTSD
jgi:hypothetical protein